MKIHENQKGKATVIISLGWQIFSAKMFVGQWQNKNKNNSKLQTYFENTAMFITCSYS